MERRHTFVLTPFDAQGAARIERTLGGFEGVQAVAAEPATARVRLSYVPGRVGVGELEEALAAAGFAVAGGWWPRLKRAWAGLTDGGGEAGGYLGGGCCGVPDEVKRRR